MGGKTWSREEELVFWLKLIPYTSKRLGEDLANEEHDWTWVAEQMEERMGKKARRNYTHLSVFEHYFQNTVLGRASPNVGKLAKKYFEYEQEAKELKEAALLEVAGFPPNKKKTPAKVKDEQKKVKDEIKEETLKEEDTDLEDTKVKEEDSMEEDVKQESDTEVIKVEDTDEEMEEAYASEEDEDDNVGGEAKGVIKREVKKETDLQVKKEEDVEVKVKVEPDITANPVVKFEASGGRYDPIELDCQYITLPPSHSHAPVPEFTIAPAATSFDTAGSLPTHLHDRFYQFLANHSRLGHTEPEDEGLFVAQPRSSWVNMPAPPGDYGYHH